MTTCPKCGRSNEPAARICPGCGVIMSKVRPKTEEAAMEPGGVSPRPGRALPPPLPIPPRPSPARMGAPPSLASTQRDDGHTSPGHAALKVGLAAAAALAALVGFYRMEKTPAAPAFSSSTPAPAVEPPPGPALAPVSAKDASSLSPDDVAFLNDLSARLSRAGGVLATEAESDRVERILAENRNSEPLKALFIGMLMRRADRDLRQGSFALVDLSLGKMKLIDDQQPQIYVMETQARATQGDWAGALIAAQRYESGPGEATVHMSFMMALILDRLGRKADSAAVLDRPIFETCAGAATPSDVSACTAAGQMRAALLASAPAPAEATPPARARATVNIDASKSQIQSERFDVRFDGESQTGVARDVLFVLDRAYTRLTDVYYDRPSAKIPVILHSSQDYYTKTGAPWWSGGVYNSHDGAIQIPIRGLPSTLPREMEDVLVHELSHAFVDEMSGGHAGHDLQEGLAQYMEGKRIEQMLGLSELRRLAHSNGQDVGNFYMISLAVSEQLVRSRGQGMINQLLKAMKDTGSEDGGYRKTFGQSGEAMKKEILETFWRRYS